jgi:type II secretory pathway component PulK
MNRNGFALLAVLWAVTVTAALALAATVVVSDELRAARNRVAATRAIWRAEGCLARAWAILESAAPSDSAWDELGRAWNMLWPMTGDCAVTLQPAGYAVDVNSASPERLVRLLVAAGLSGPAADSLASAILDWRDRDDIARPAGAEAAWYRAAQAVLPRNGPLQADAELRLVRGMESVALADSLLGTEPGRTPVNLAPLTVIASLPGVGPELVARVADRRRWGQRYATLAELGEGLSPPARDVFLARFAGLVEVASVIPEAWMLRVSATDGQPLVTRTIEVRLITSGGRPVATRRRQW